MSHLGGLHLVMTNLRREVGKVKSKLNSSMIAAGFYIKGAAQNLTPVDTGNLRGSARNRWEKKTDGIRVIVYYEASYAVVVHEVDRWHRVGTWKYLEKAVVDNWNEIIEIIKKGPAIP